DTDQSEAYRDGALKDGVIDESEADAIEKYLNTLEAEKESIGSEVDVLLNNDYIGDLYAGIDLFYEGYTQRYYDLISAINAAISDGRVTEAEKQEVDERFSEYKDYRKDMFAVIDFAQNEIAKNITNEADEFLRHDLRLTSSLPTSITMNQDGITAYTTQEDSYARLDHRGLYIRNGAIQIDGDFSSPIQKGFNDIGDEVKITSAGL